MRYIPSEHMFRHVMLNQHLYARYVNLKMLVVCSPWRVGHIANTAYNIASDAVQDAMERQQFDPQYNTIELVLGVANKLVKDAVVAVEANIH